MPLDLETLSGTFKLCNKSDNLVQLLQKLGEPPQLIENLERVEMQLEIKVTGNNFTAKTTMMGMASVNTYTLGAECEEKGLQNRKVTCTIQGDALVSDYPNHDGKGLVVRRSRRFLDDNTVRTEYKVGDLEGWYDFKKI
ncbi:Hypp4548 [Branchiostoma lanceolatum]|uniref:Hypp4548 protein n=1 Tax=Branchiostoma lanceolatum TaxID=7740 RepID=A0A8K0EYT8_BRALA|nr:Hypp4548 [Branchiostoma lanceolatum]